MTRPHGLALPCLVLCLLAGLGAAVAVAPGPATDRSADRYRTDDGFPHASRAHDEGPSRPPDGGRAAVPADLPALDVLRAWDLRRAAAYEAGSVRMLRHLYVDGSGAGRSDQRVLRGYLARGFHVEGMRMQVLSLAVLDVRPHRLRMRVTDRLGGAVAVGFRSRVPLPRDGPSTRLVTLVRGADGLWRVSTVAPVR